jgi:putative MATE family efflux protein
VTSSIKATGNERNEALGREKISKLLLRFSGPAILACEASAFYNLFDAIWCGRLGAEAIAALSVAHPLMHIYMAIGGGIGVGAASLIARKLGAGEKEEAYRTACCSISFFFIIGSLMTLICLPNLRTLLRIFGAGDSVLPFAYDYMLIETGTIIVNFFLVVLVELVRIGGSPSIASAGTITASIMDLVWSPLLVFGVGPLPALGIAGAALGTTIGRAAGASLLLAYLGLGKSIYQFKRSYFIPNLRIITNVYRVGISRTVQTGAGSISLAIANNIAAGFGVIPLAVLGIVDKVQMVVISLCIGISQGMLPLVGYNYGAQKNERIGEIVVKAGLTSFAWGALCWVVVNLFPGHILSLFGADPSFLAGGITALRLFALGFFASGVQSNLSSFFQGIGKGTASLVVASSRQVIILVPCLLVLSNVLGLAGLWAAYPMADFLSLLLSLSWVFIVFRSLGIPFRLRSISPTPLPTPQQSP